MVAGSAVAAAAPPGLFMGLRERRGGAVMKLWPSSGQVLARPRFLPRRTRTQGPPRLSPPCPVAMARGQAGGIPSHAVGRAGQGWQGKFLRFLAAVQIHVLVLSFIFSKRCCVRLSWP